MFQIDPPFFFAGVWDGDCAGGAELDTETAVEAVLFFAYPISEPPPQLLT
jgi:hypothetical protein